MVQPRLDGPSQRSYFVLDDRHPPRSPQRRVEYYSPLRVGTPRRSGRTTTILRRQRPQQAGASDAEALIRDTLVEVSTAALAGTLVLTEAAPVGTLSAEAKVESP